MVPLLEGQRAVPQEPQKIHRFTIPQHGSTRLKEAHIKDEKAKEEKIPFYTNLAHALPNL